MKLSDKEKILLAVTLLLGVVFSSRYAFSGMFSGLPGAMITAKEQEISVNRMLIREKDRIEKLSEEYAPYLKPVTASDGEELTAMLRKIEAVAGRSGISLDTLKPYGIEERTDHRKYSVEIECFAPVNKLVTFMHHLGNTGGLFAISKMQVTPQARGAGEQKIGMLVTRHAFTDQRGRTPSRVH